MTTHLTTADLAARWHRPVAWVRQQAAVGAIPAMQIGDQWRFDLADIERYEQRKRNGYRDPLTMTDLSAKRQGATR